MTKRSLASHAGPRVSFIVTICVLVSHAFFFYAQLSGLSSECGPVPPDGPGPCEGEGKAGDEHDPGGLLTASIDAHIEYDAAGALALGLEALTTAMCYEKGQYDSCPDGRHTKLGNLSDASSAVCGVLECGGLEYRMTLLHISYMYSIEHLWIQPGWRPDEKPTGVYPGRPASGMLFFWSFLWPHIKLVLLHSFFYLPLPAPLRRNGQWWFAFFGKWSLADVLVMAAVLALFDLDVNMSLVELWQNVAPHFLPLCDAICLTSYYNLTNISNIDFNNASAPLPPSNCSKACTLADVALSVGVTPASLPDSQLHVNLKIEGINAMYAFCIAVLLSLSTGVWVDALDEDFRASRRDDGSSIRKARPIPTPPLCAAHQLSGCSTTIGDSLSSSTHPVMSSSAVGYGNHGGRSSNGGLGASLLSGGAANSSSSGGGGGDPSGNFAAAESSEWAATYHARLRTGSGRRQERLTRGMHVVLVLIQLVAVIGAFTLPSFERQVHGSIADLLLQAGVDFTQKVSLWQLPALTARGGGLDYLMAATFTLFIIVAPVVRSLSLLALLVIPMKRSTARRLHTYSTRVVAYTALDVMLIATPLIGVAFGPMSEVLLNKAVLPLCGTLDHIYGTGDICMRIDVLPRVGYWFNVGAIVMMLLSGFDGSPTSKCILRRLYLDDPNPPPNCICKE